MRKLTVFLVLAAMLISTAAFAQYAGSWSKVWDFSNGTQGWSLSGGFWTDPGWVSPDGPTLGDGAPSGGGNANLYLPDGKVAKIDVSSANLGSGAGRKGFVMQADVYVPNLYGYPGAVFPQSLPGNGIHQAGIGAISTNALKEIYVEGKVDTTRATVFARDRNWDNTDRWMGSATNLNLLKQTEPAKDMWWDDWVTMQIDYNYSVANKWTAYVYIPWVSTVGDAGWYQATTSTGQKWFDTGSYNFTQLRLGGGASWTQAQFDNVKLAIAPEPSSMLALATGLFGMAGFAIRRRK